MILNIFFPRICIWCGISWSYLCSKCKKSLQPHPEICPITHKNSPWYSVRQDLLTQQNHLDWCIVLFRFEPLIKKLITKLKYHHREDISEFLWKRLALALQSHEHLSLIDSSKSVITYVPSHRYRHYITKWYNQSKLLANALVQWLEKNMKVSQICYKTKNTHSQVGMKKNERTKNLTDAFKVTASITPWTTIIIVDDVLTSGATMIELAKTIKDQQPDCEVRWICVARNG